MLCEGSSLCCTASQETVVEKVQEQLGLLSPHKLLFLALFFVAIVPLDHYNTHIFIVYQVEPKDFLTL